MKSLKRERECKGTGERFARENPHFSTRKFALSAIYVSLREKKRLYWSPMNCGKYNFLLRVAKLFGQRWVARKDSTGDMF